MKTRRYAGGGDIQSKIDILQKLIDNPKTPEKDKENFRNTLEQFKEKLKSEKPKEEKPKTTPTARPKSKTTARPKSKTTARPKATTTAKPKTTTARPKVVSKAKPTATEKKCQRGFN